MCDRCGREERCILDFGGETYLISPVSAGCVIGVAERRGAYWILVVRPDERRPLGRPRCRWIVKKWDEEA